MKRTFLAAVALAVAAPVMGALPASATVKPPEPTRPTISAKAVAKQSGKALTKRMNAAGVSPKIKPGQKVVTNKASRSERAEVAAYVRVSNKQFCVVVAVKGKPSMWVYNSQAGTTVKADTGAASTSTCMKGLYGTVEAQAAQDEAISVALMLPMPYPKVFPTWMNGVVAPESTVSFYTRRQQGGTHQVRFCVVRASGAWAVYDTKRGMMRSGWQEGRCVGAAPKRA